jgi:hypothetical protein
MNQITIEEVYSTIGKLYLEKETNVNALLKENESLKKEVLELRKKDINKNPTDVPETTKKAA